MLKNVFGAITRLSLRFKWITIALTVILLVLGVIGALQMNQELLPPVEFPQAFVFTVRPGASSEDLRDLVTLPLEEKISQIKGVIPAGLESTTTAPVSVLIVRYNYGVNGAAIQAEIDKKIQEVMNEGVPSGLKTTKDLTPEIMTSVLKKAPSMFAHFESRHLLAMSPAVLDAALAFDPTLADKIDVLTRDQLAAERVDAALSGKAAEKAAVNLPSAWIMTKENSPAQRTFNFSSLPVVIASVSTAKSDYLLF